MRNLVLMAGLVTASLMALPASATKLELIPDVSGSAIHIVANNAVGGKYSHTSLASYTLVIDVDTNIIFECKASLDYTLLNSVYQNEQHNAYCRPVQTAPASGPITDFKIQAPYFNPANGSDPGVVRPAFFWEVSKGTDVSVCMQVPSVGAGLPFAASRLFGLIHCQSAPVDMSKIVVDPADPLVELGDVSP
ncbi:hypothetical protein ACHMW7_05910 [Aminobacter sp. UC22_36]|uniref:hypothetical protein n=1 Tax=Aminobacter sp. UC22_36 TaxID=3374549 RepID=UPI00375688D4